MLENFAEYDDYFPHSKNHHFLGDVINWFMSKLAGISVQNPKEVVIKPNFVKVLDWCKASHKLPNGKISVCWKRTDNGIDLEVTSSGDVKYTVELNESITKKVTLINK